PGMTVRPLRSMTLVPASASLRISSLRPTALMRFPVTATACAIAKRSFTVTILPLINIVSTACAPNEVKNINKNKYLCIFIIIVASAMPVRARHSSIDLLANLTHHALHRRNGVVFEQIRRWQRNMRCGDANDRPVEIPETLIGNDGRNLRAPAAQARILFDR